MSTSFLKDTTGRKLKPGQFVDVPMNGMFRGRVVQVEEPSSLITSESPSASGRPGFIIIEIVTRLVQTERDGGVQNVYIVLQPEDLARIKRQQDGGATTPFEDPSLDEQVN